MQQGKFIPALGYDWLTAFYDLTVRLTMPEKKFRTKLIDELAPVNGESILEFGFGTGQNLILAQQGNPSVKLRGVDIDPKVKGIAQRKMDKLGIDLPLDLYDGKTFPYADHSFDKVFSSLVFHQLDREDKLGSLKEIYRVLKHGGQLIIGDWGEASCPLMRLAFFAIQFVDGFKTTNDNVNGLMPEFISKAGFISVVETYYINTNVGTYSYYRAKKPA